jgi:hypothetical protein
MSGGQTGVRDFQNRSDLMQMLDIQLHAGGPQKQRQRPRDLFVSDCPNRGPDPVARLQQAFGHEDPDGFPNHRTAYREAFGKLPFGRQPGADGEASVEDLALEGLNDPSY